MKTSHKERKLPPSHSTSSSHFSQRSLDPKEEEEEVETNGKWVGSSLVLI
jgi:hypothetical protein